MRQGGVWLFFIFWSNSELFAQGYSGLSDVQLLHGKNLSTLTLEHAGNSASFAMFGFADIFYLDGQEGLDVYSELYPKISLIRFAKDRETFVKEIFFGTGINVLVGEDFFTWVAGPVTQFKVPAFDLFQLETYYYKQANDQQNDYNGTVQLTYSWSLPIPVSQKLKLLTRGFADYIGDRGPGTWQIVTQPQLLLDVGNFWNSPGKLYTGTEWNYWKNIGGNKEARRSIIQLEILWFL